MIVRFPLLLGSLALLLAAVGCESSDAAANRSTFRLSLPPDSDRADRLWSTAQEVLREHRFALDRVDRGAGVITTRPEGSQHFFEFWRHDVDTWSDRWEATMNSIRRWVEVTIRPAEDGIESEIAVVVHKERISSADRQFNNTGAAFQFFGSSLPSTAGKPIDPAADRWLSLGRDPAMELRLLNRIVERMDKSNAHAKTPDSRTVEDSR